MRVPAAAARFGVISDVDDTILETGVQRALRMVVQTFTGSALTRTAFPGAPELYRDLAAGVNPVFYVSSSPWNLHAFLLAFLRHRDFPIGPVLLRDLLGTRAGREQKHQRIREILDLHPDLPFVLLGDSGEKDPRDLRRHRARVPGPDPRGLHPRGAARPGRRAGGEGVRRVGVGRAVRAAPPTPTPYAGTRRASGCSERRRSSSPA